MKDGHLLEEVVGSFAERYRSVVEEQTELICRFLPDGTLTFVNKSFCCYFGTHSESPIGQNFFQLILQVPGEGAEGHLLPLNREHPVATCERQMLSASGQVCWLQWTDKGIFDRSGELVEFQSVGRDITESKLLAQKEKQLLHLLARVVKDSALYLLDVGGCIASWNLEAQHIYGFTEAEIIGQSFSRLFPPESIQIGQPADYLQQAQNREFYEVESKRIRADGSEFWVNGTIAPLRDSRGQICGFAEAVRDLTAERLAASNLTEIQAKYQTVLQVCPVGILIADPAGNICEANQAAVDMLGITHANNSLHFDKSLDVKVQSKIVKVTPIIDNRITTIIASRLAEENVEIESEIEREIWEIPAEIAADWHRAIQTVFATGIQQVTELERSLQGRIKSYQAHLIPQFAKDGSVASVLAIARDNTESQYATSRFGSQQELWQTIFDCLPVMVAIYSSTDRLQSINREWERVMGWSLAEAVEIDLLAECYPDLTDRQTVAETIARSDGTWHEFTTQVRNGSIADISWANIRLSDGTRIEIGQNLIERKQAETALRASEERFRATFEQAAVGMVTFLPNGRFFRINQKFCEIVGYDRAELLAKTYFDITHPDDLPVDVACAQSLYAGEIPNYSIEKRYIRKDGIPVWVNVSASLVRNSEGLPQYTLAVVEDISVRKQAEANLERAYNRLREREELYRTLTTHAPVGIFQTNAEGEVTFVNQQWCSIAGMTREQVTDSGWREALHPEDWERLRAMRAIPYRQRLQQATPENGEGEMLTTETVRPVEFKFVAADGKISWAIGKSSPLRDANGKFQGIIGTLLDISDRKKAEERLAKINECFLEFSGDPTENINRLTALCGELLGASCALYNRLQGEMLCCLGEWYSPGECQRDRGEAGEICYTAIQAGTDELLVVRNSLEGDTGSDDRWQTYLAGPVKCQNIGVGALCAAYRWDFGPSEDERRVMGIIAGAIGVEEERLRVEEALRLQTEREHLMGAIAQRVRQSLDMEAILNTTVAEVRQFLSCDRVAIFCLGAGGTSKVMTEAVAPEWPTLLGESFPRDCFPRRFYRPPSDADRVVPVGASNPVNDCFNDFLEQMGIVSKLVVPILNSERWRSQRQGEETGQGQGEDAESFWGLLVAQHDPKPRQWQEWEVEWLSALAAQAGIAIEQSQLYEQLKAANQELQRQATIDGLTQVANRRRFDEYLMQEWRRSARHQAPISLIMCDVDFFKRYNDGHGHLAGDDCLKQVAAAIVGALKRPGDLAARYGGEEFAVILPCTDAAGAFCVAEEIRAQVCGLQIPHGNSAVNSCVTMSLGVATAVAIPHSVPEELIVAADGALYCAKERGRDRVIQKVIENWELGIGNWELGIGNG
ncbi:MAG: PAS domain S-box protein [Microcoleus sp.]